MVSPGSRIGPYEVTALIGEGGMGKVWRARHTTLKRDDALKVLPEGFATAASWLARFEREAQVLASLNHPNIAQIYGLEHADGTPCIVMELLEGETLRARLARGPLTVQHATSIVVAIADALSMAHAKGVIHRDLKPENIFLTADGRTKVLDFGLARWQPADADLDLAETTLRTQAGVLMGTVGYMSPEQARGERADVTSDIFSLGCVLYEMLTARAAFTRSSAAETLAAILTEQPVVLDGLPPNVRRVVGRCLEKHPADRFQSARDLASGVRELTSAAADSVPEDSLAVLPFANAGGPDAEYLSDGIAESLTNAFSQIARLRVVPRSLVSRYKGRDIDPRVVGLELGARMLLSGKVVERAGRLSVQVELVDAAANKQLWGDRLHRPLSDIFEVEEEITRQIADRLRVRLSGAEKRQLARRYTDNSEAYQLYLKARFHFLQRTAEGLQKGIEYCEQAIAEDPGFALAHAGLADCYGVLAAVGPSAPQPIAARAKAAAIRAVECDDTLPEAQTALAYARAYVDWDWAGAEAGFRRALALNPSYWLTHDWYALTLSCEGRMAEALDHNRRAQELEPSSPVLHHHAAWLSWLARCNDDAIDQSERTLELDAGFGWAHLWSGLALEQKGAHEQAVADLRKAVKLTGATSQAVAALIHALAQCGEGDEGRRMLAEIERPSSARYVEPYAMAVACMGFGNLEQAVSWLTKAFEERSVWWAMFGRCDPRIDAVRGDARVRDLFRRMRFDG